MNELIKGILKGGDLWSRLLKSEKNLLVYGMGNGAEKLLDVCEKRGIKISGVFCSDGFERNKIFRGFPVRGMSETLKYFSDPLILVAFGSHDENTLKMISELAEKYELYIPDLPVYCESENVNDDIFDSEYYGKNIEKISAARALFSDERSRELYDLIIAYKLSGRLDLLEIAATANEPEAFEKDIKICVDAGAYRGDTIEERFARSPSVGRIYAVEPDEKNAARLEKLYGEDPRVMIIKAAVGKSEKRAVFLSGNGRGGALGKSDTRAKRRLVDIVTVDGITEGKKIDFIKYDVEGAERSALAGSAETIEKYLPYLRVSAYHKTADIFGLPLYLNELSAGRYKLFLRRKYCVPAWEIDIVAVEKRRELAPAGRLPVPTCARKTMIVVSSEHGISF